MESQNEMWDLNGNHQLVDFEWKDLHPRRPSVGVSSLRNAVTMFDLQGPEPYVHLLGHGTGEITETYFSSDARRVVSRASDMTIRVWDADSQGVPWMVPGRETFAVSGEGRWTAEAGWGNVRLWDARTGWPVWNTIVSRHSILSLAFDHDSRFLAAGQDDGRIWVIDVASGKVQRKLLRRAAGVLSLAWSPDGRILALSGLDGVTRTLDSKTGRELRSFGGPSASAHLVAMSPDGGLLATGGHGPDAPNAWRGKALPPGTGGVRIWDAGSGRLVRELDPSERTVKDLAFHPDGKSLFAGYSDGTISAWDISSGAQRVAPGEGGHIRGLTFGLQGTRLVVGRDEKVEIVDPGSMEVLISFSTPRASAQAAAFSDNGSLVCAGLDSALLIFDGASPAEGYARRAAARRAASLLDLHGRTANIPDLASTVRSMSDLSDEDRRDAIAYANAFGVNPSQMNSEALLWVRRTDASREDYLLALKRIQAALPYFPEDVYFLRTLALAQMRLGDHAGALETADRGERIQPTDGEKPLPAYLTVRVLSNAALGRRAEAEIALRRLREAVKDPEESKNVEWQDFLAEAERAVAGQRSAK
jgi:WD40 repeat protein